MNENLRLDSYVGECREWWDTSHWERLTHTRMANSMEAVLVSGSLLDPVRVASQGNNLAEETR